MYKYGELAQVTLEQLTSKGAFLTVKSGEKLNTMSIGWGSLSQYWNEDVFIVPVRHSRYTFELLKNAKEFTVSVPLNGKLDEALKICGTKSGRDGDKLALAGLKTSAAKSVSTPVIEGCSIYYECEIVYSSEVLPENLSEDVMKKAYATGDMHRLFFGRIVSAYTK